MPKVTTQIRIIRFFIWLMALCGLQMAGQTSKVIPASHEPGPGVTLYTQLRSVGLDSSRVYRVRDATLDRTSLHISLNDGTIAFTQDVAGRITGAFFEGDGEVLLSPPDQIERSSMALFTGAAILEEEFSTAYLRFNDDTFKDLKPFLRPPENSEAFISKWNDSARNLAEEDALRLLTTFSRLLPTDKTALTPILTLDPDDRMLHLRVQGRKLGVFDVFFDSTAKEQVSAGQFQTTDGQNNYDVWTSFSLKNRSSEPSTAEIAGEEENTGDIEISHYKISAEIKPPTQLEADTQLQMLVRHTGARAVLFELSRYLQVRQVTANGRPVEFIHNPALEGTQLERRGDDIVAVIFPEPLRAGQRIELRFSYAGAVLSDAGGGLLYVGARGTWYPNRGLSKSTFDLEFRYQPGWTLIATGKRENESAIPDKMPYDAPPATQPLQVSHWISDTPIPVAGFNLGKYSHVENHAGSVAVDVYAASRMERGFPQASEVGVLPQPPFFPWQPQIPIMIDQLPPSPAGNAQSVADDAARAISFFSAHFGSYPYNSLAVTQMPGSLSQGWPGLIFLSSFSFLTAGQKSAIHMTPVQHTISDDVIAHETAHQWWGDLVTWSGYRDQWISEALANYSSLLLLESQHPPQFRALMEKYRDDLLLKDKNGMRYLESGPVTLGTRLTSSKFPNGYETIAYERGTWLFHMLRTIMRDSEQNSSARRSGGKSSFDEPFLLALRQLREQYQTRPISTLELMRIFEKHLPPSAWHEGRKSLDWFYQGWINGTAIPALQLQSVKYTDKSNSTIVTGTIQQKDAPMDLVTSVPLYALLNGKDVFVGRVFADGQETQFHLTAPLGTRKLLLDPNHSVLSRPH